MGVLSETPYLTRLKETEKRAGLGDSSFTDERGRQEITTRER